MTVPDVVDLADELPRTSVGKIQKRLLRAAPWRVPTAVAVSEADGRADRVNRTDVVRFTPIDSNRTNPSTPRGRRAEQSPGADSSSLRPLPGEVLAITDLRSPTWMRPTSPWSAGPLMPLRSVLVMASAVRA